MHDVASYKNDSVIIKYTSYTFATLTEGVIR